MFYQCKMCGGTLDIKNSDAVGICEYCGTKQTLPRLDNEKKANLYDRAAHFRQINDFDKAMSLYEQVLAEDKTDAEAYWSIVLCRYGIEYVEDPATHKRIPTVNRTQYTSIFNDTDYKSALQYADPFQSEIYEQEAKAIDDIQKGILKISKNEEPFDIFICYKESDDNGRRTIDSVLAYDVYKELVGAGYKVFFSRITLEDKVGTAYEPYIFAALNSAPIMLVIGTKQEYFNAVWVKNEWSRFLGMIKAGAKKTLIPMYKDMNPYDLPEEFAHLQAQDMNNLGYMQDLLRGIKKITSGSQVTSSPVNMMMSGSKDASSQGEEISKLLSRADFALDNHQWREADEFFEGILRIDPKYAAAYVGKLMAEMQVAEMDDLKVCAFDTEKNVNFKNAMRCAEGELKQQLLSLKNAIINTRYIKTIKKRKNMRIAIVVSLFFILAGIIGFMVYVKIIMPKRTYEQACVFLEKGDYDSAIRQFEKIENYKDTTEKLIECRSFVEKRTTIKNAKEGDIIQYGNYKGNMEWVVVNRENDKLLLISKTCITKKPFSEVDGDVDWDVCTLRNWLNNEFYKEAFNESEHSQIVETDVKVNSRSWRLDDDEFVKDKIFLFSIFDDDFSRLTSDILNVDETWWLRTPSYIFGTSERANKKVAVISSNGSIWRDGHYATDDSIGVRPAMWIDVSDL